MKFVDKFALVPIERYNQLFKGINSENNKIEHTEQKGAGEEQKTEDIDRKKAGKIVNEPLDTKINDSREIHTKSNNSTQIGNKTGNKAIKEKNYKKAPTGKTIAKPNKKAFRKFPPPPPGIPNILKKSDFKWLSLF